MIAALALGIAGAGEPVPLPSSVSSGPHFSGDVRVGTLFGQVPQRSTVERQLGLPPNAQLTATLGVGARGFQGIVGTSAAFGHYHLERQEEWGGGRRRYTWVRVEGRAGARGDLPVVGLTLAGELGVVVFPWPHPLLVGTVGWVGPSGRVRPTVALEGRLSGCLYEASLPGGVSCPAQNGVALTAGVRWGNRHRRVDAPPGRSTR